MLHALCLLQSKAPILTQRQGRRSTTWLHCTEVRSLSHRTVAPVLPLLCRTEHVCYYCGARLEVKELILYATTRKKGIVAEAQLCRSKVLIWSFALMCEF